LAGGVDNARAAWNLFQTTLGAIGVITIIGAIIEGVKYLKSVSPQENRESSAKQGLVLRSVAVLTGLMAAVANAMDLKGTYLSDWTYMIRTFRTMVDLMGISLIAKNFNKKKREARNTASYGYVRRGFQVLRNLVIMDPYQIHSCSEFRNFGDNKCGYCHVCGWEKADHNLENIINPEVEEEVSKIVGEDRQKIFEPKDEHSPTFDSQIFLASETKDFDSVSYTLFFGMYLQKVREWFLESYERIVAMSDKSKKMVIVSLITCFISALAFAIWYYDLFGKFFGEDQEVSDESLAEREVRPKKGPKRGRAYRKKKKNYVNGSGDQTDTDTGEYWVDQYDLDQQRKARLDHSMYRAMNEDDDASAQYDQDRYLDKYFKGQNLLNPFDQDWGEPQPRRQSVSRCPRCDHKYQDGIPMVKNPKTEEKKKASPVVQGDQVNTQLLAIVQQLQREVAQLRSGKETGPVEKVRELVKTPTNTTATTTTYSKIPVIVSDDKQPKAQGREAAVKGSELLPATTPPPAYKVYSGKVHIGFATHYKSTMNGKTFIAFPKHFMKEENLTIGIDQKQGEKTTTKFYTIFREKVKVSGFYDLAVLKDDELKKNMKQVTVGQQTMDFTPHITVERNGKWMYAVSTTKFNPNGQTKEDGEAIYNCPTQPGDCGLPVIFEHCAYGLHVGTEGDYNGNLFLKFTPRVLVEIFSLEGVL